jgi:hypothetical protein
VRKNVFRLAVAALLLTMPGAEAADLKHSADTDLEFKRREALLMAEMRAGDVPQWAGEFTRGDGLGVNVRMLIAPDGGFVFTWHGCLGLYDINYGSVEVRDGHLLLRFELPNTEQGFEGIAGEFVPVRWGDRLYLLAAREARQFANAINGGFEPCTGTCARFLLRAGDEQKSATGRPELPPEFLLYLLAEPIDARVVKVLQNVTRSEDKTGFSWRTREVELDVGSKAGVWEGMAFHDVSAGETFHVTQVREDNSIALSFEPYITDMGQKKVASCLSTSSSGSRCGTSL